MQRRVHLQLLHAERRRRADDDAHVGFEDFCDDAVLLALFLGADRDRVDAEDAPCMPCSMVFGGKQLGLVFERIVLLVDVHIDGFAEPLGEVEDEIEMRLRARPVARGRPPQ